MPAVLTGSAFALAQWFQAPQDTNRSDQDHVREAILSECYRFTEWGSTKTANGTVLILKTPGGRCVVETQTQGPDKVVIFDYAPSHCWVRTRFWMNASSVRDLGERLRKAADRKQPFDSLFVNV